MTRIYAIKELYTCRELIRFNDAIFDLRMPHRAAVCLTERIMQWWECSARLQVNRIRVAEFLEKTISYRRCLQERGTRVVLYYIHIRI